ncbi:MAG: radical SAM protein [Elusimicrobiales bacterium]|nr:radical SAM protein [Elusimicrobiales bacterium]
MRVALLLPLFPEVLIRLSVRGEGDFPLGLGYIAACLRREGHTAAIFIPDGIRLGMKRVWRELEEFRPDILGLSALTQNFMEARRVTMEAKRRLGCPVVMGGPHPTALPRSTLEGLPELDAVIRGEAELSMLALAAEFDRSGRVDFGKVPGAAYLKGGEYVANPFPDFISDLDSLPLPAADLYNSVKTGFGSNKILTSRGCPGRCNFCANICMGKKFRAHSPERVVDEMERLVREQGAFFLQISDDCFTADAARVHRICDLIISRGLKIYWDAAGRVNTMQDENLIVKMKKAGLVRVVLGVETGSQEISDLMRKGTTLEMAERCCRLLRKHGVDIYTSFIFGSEGETLKTLWRTVAFSFRLKPTIASYTPLIPFPGTPIFDKYYKDFDRPGTDWTGWCSFGPFRPCEPRQTRLSYLTLWVCSVLAMLCYMLYPPQLLRLFLASVRFAALSPK